MHDSVNFRIELGDVSGCISKSNVAGQRFVDNTIPDSPGLRCVIVNPNGSVAMNWVADPDTGLDFNSYHIYQSNNAAGPYTVIDSIFNYNTYKLLELPLLFEEDALFILLVENTLMLNEITIRATRLYPNKINDRTKITPRTMSSLDGFISPITYLGKLEREKRILLRVVEENNRTQTFRQVITDPDVKEILMRDYEVSEEIYYHTIENFNLQHAAVHYFTDPDAIMEALHSFFEKQLAGK